MSTPGLSLWLDDVPADDEPLCSCGEPLQNATLEDHSDEDGSCFRWEGICPTCDAEPCANGGCTALMEWDDDERDFVCRACDAREEAAA